MSNAKSVADMKETAVEREANEEMKTEARNGEATTNAGPGGFDLARLRLPQNFAGQAGVKKLVNTLPVRTPGKTDWVRTHPDPSFRVQAGVLADKENRESFVVVPELMDEMAGVAARMEIVTSITRQGVLFVWTLRLPREDGRTDYWAETAMEAAAMAQTTWVRVVANMSLGAYEIFRPEGELSEPEWPDLSFDRIVEIAFRGRIIDSMDHPILQRLRGLR